MKESDVGTECGLFEVRKIGDEYFAFLVECKNPKACTILLRGASKDILNEVCGGEGRGGEGEGRGRGREGEREERRGGGRRVKEGVWVES